VLDVTVIAPEAADELRQLSRDIDDARLGAAG
jgi:hypothetical protein